jgi:hypothetical protein
MTPSTDTDTEVAPWLTEAYTPSGAALTLLDRDRIAATLLMLHMLCRYRDEYAGLAGLREASNLVEQLRQQVCRGIDEAVVDEVTRLIRRSLEIHQFPSLESFDDEADDWQDSYLS